MGASFTMIKNVGWIFFLIGAVFLGLSETVLAQEGKVTALEIMEKIEHANMTMDQSSLVTMILIDNKGNERTIETVRLHKHYAGKDGLDSKSVFYTESPPDQKGTGFLIWDYAIEGKPDDLWLYLPSLRSVKRMTTRDQNDSFMGSDLTFSDMGARRLNEDTHELIFEGPCPGMTEPCYVIDSIPKEKGSPYGKKRYFISKKDWVAEKVEFYDRNMKPLKLQITKWQRVDNVLVWQQSDIHNVQSEHKTIFKISNIKNDIGLSDDSFSERRLSGGAPR